MATRKTPSLTEVLAAFKKEANEIFAEDTPAMTPAPAVAPVAMEALPTHSDPLVLAAKRVSEAADRLKGVEEAATTQQQQLTERADVLYSAKDTLKAIAQTAIENQQEAIVKEASLFGEIFAATVMDEFQKTAQLDAIQSETYNMTLDKLAFEQVSPELEKIAQEAYELTLTKLAFDEGYTAVMPEQMQQMQQIDPAMQGQMQQVDPAMQEQQQVVPAMLPQADPEMDEAALMEKLQLLQQLQQEAEDGEDENLGTATEAALEAAKAARAAAEAAQEAIQAAAEDATPEQVSEVVEELPKIAHDAYEQTMAYLNNSMDIDAALSKVAQDAYELTMEALQ